jgi:hypothetical protein
VKDFLLATCSGGKRKAKEQSMKRVVKVLKIAETFPQEAIDCHQMLINSLSPQLLLSFLVADDRNGHKNRNPKSPFYAGDQQ